MDSSSPHTRLCNWASLAVAVALGPAFIIIGYRIHGLVFGAATGAGLLTTSGRPRAATCHKMEILAGYAIAICSLPLLLRQHHNQRQQNMTLPLRFNQQRERGLASAEGRRNLQSLCNHLT